MVEWRGVRGYFKLYQLPRGLLSEFDLAEREDIFARGGLALDSLWDALERGVRWRGWNWRSPEAAALGALQAYLEGGGEDFMFCYTAELDELLHREGCSGAGVLQRLDACAGRLEALERGAARRGEKHRLYLLSDHGMVDVHATLDVMVGAMVRLARQLEPERFA